MKYINGELCGKDLRLQLLTNGRCRPPWYHPLLCLLVLLSLLPLLVLDLYSGAEAIHR